MIYNLLDTEKVVLIEKFIEIQALLQETTKTSNKQSNVISKGIQKKKNKENLKLIVKERKKRSDQK